MFKPFRLSLSHEPVVRAATILNDAGIKLNKTNVEWWLRSYGKTNGTIDNIPRFKGDEASFQKASVWVDQKYKFKGDL